LKLVKEGRPAFVSAGTPAPMAGAITYLDALRHRASVAGGSCPRLVA
jgi:hypothetical protein